MTEEKLDAGYKNIGEFICKFSQLEFSIRTALSAALRLSDEQVDIVTAPYDFVVLCTVASAILIQRYPEEKTDIEKIFKECRALNDQRVRVAHGLWWTFGENGLMARHVARQSLKADFYFDDPAILTDLVATADRLTGVLLGWQATP